MDKFCFSCSAPLDLPDFKGPTENYCKHCTDAEGNLRARSEIQSGVAQWFKTWQPDLDADRVAKRAESFLNAMPAWAEV